MTNPVFYLIHHKSNPQVTPSQSLITLYYVTIATIEI